MNAPMTNEPPIIESSSPPQNAKPRMSILGKLIVIYAIFFFIDFIGSTSIALYLQQKDIVFFLGLPIVLVFPVFYLSIACIFIEWRRRRWLAFLPMMTCILSFVITGTVAGGMRHAFFVRSLLPSYESVVQKMESGIISVYKVNQMQEIKTQALLAYGVYAWRDTNGCLVAQFLTDGGIPSRKPSGYLYSSSKDVKPRDLEDSLRKLSDDSRWHVGGEEKPQWFHIYVK